MSEQPPFIYVPMPIQNYTQNSYQKPKSRQLELKHDQYTQTLKDYQRREVHKPEFQYQLYPNVQNRVAPGAISFQEFQRKVLPTLRLGKLKKMQALVRGWYVRKYIYPYKRMLYHASRKLTQELMQEFLQDYILPDLLLQILNSNSLTRDYSLYSPQTRLVVMVADSIQRQLTDVLCQQSVRQVTKFIIDNYLRKRFEQKIVNKSYDPLTLITDQLANQAADSMLQSLAKQILKEEAQEYMYEAKVIHLLRDEFVPIYCYEVLNQAAQQIAIQDVLDDCFRHAMNQHIRDTIIDSTQEQKIRLNQIALQQAFDVFMQRVFGIEAIQNIQQQDLKRREEQEIFQKARIPDQNISEFVLQNFYQDELPPGSFLDGSNQTADRRTLNKTSNRLRQADKKLTFMNLKQTMDNDMRDALIGPQQEDLEEDLEEELGPQEIRAMQLDDDQDLVYSGEIPNLSRFQDPSTSNRLKSFRKEHERSRY